MEITWYGHSCFRITERGMASVVTDPFDSGIVGYNPLKLKAEVVTLSCNDLGHNNHAAVKGEPYLITGPGEYEIGGVFITGMQTTSNKKDSKDLSNTLYVFDYGNLTVCHLGQVNSVPSQSNIEELGNINIALVPVGEGGGLNASKAAEVISMLEPNIVIPMHYETPYSKLAPNASRQILITKLQFAPRKLPQTAQKTLLRAFCDQHFRVLKNYPRADNPMRNRGFLPFDGQTVLSPKREGLATGLDWAEVTGGILRGTDGSAKIHQGLVEIPCSSFGQCALSEAPELLITYGRIERFGGIGFAGVNTAEIAIQRGLFLVEGNRKNCPCSITANARQTQQFFQVLREISGVLGNDQLGSLVQMTRAAVIAQAFPCSQHFCLVGCSKAFEGREALHPTFKIGDNRLHLCLLQHDLRHPGAVGAGMRTPGQHPGVNVVPCQQTGSKHTIQNWKFPLACTSL